MTELADTARNRRRHRSILIITAGSVCAVALASACGSDNAPAGRPAAASGLIAFVSGSGTNPGDGDLYVVRPDGTGLRRITSTPGVAEYSPTWSPDGTRLAYVRTHGGCFCLHEIVVVDPSTGAESLSTEVPDGEGAFAPLSSSLTWSPDGGSMLFIAGSEHSSSSLVVDLQAGTWLAITEGDAAIFKARWSPDGRWLLTLSNHLLAVPAELIDGTDVVDVAELLGVRKLTPEAGNTALTAVWAPDGSAIAICDFGGRQWNPVIDIITFPDGQRRRLVSSGFAPAWSPDGRQVAYLDNRERDGAGGAEVWVVAGEGATPREVGVSFIPPTWSPNGAVLLLLDGDGLFTVHTDGTGVTRLTPDELKPEAGNLNWLGAVETFAGSNGAFGDFGPDWQPTWEDSEN